MVDLEAVTTHIFFTFFTVVYSFSLFILSTCIFLISTNYTTTFWLSAYWKVLTFQSCVRCDRVSTRWSSPERISIAIQQWLY